MISSCSSLCLQQSNFSSSNHHPQSKMNHTLSSVSSTLLHLIAKDTEMLFLILPVTSSSFFSVLQMFHHHLYPLLLPLPPPPNQHASQYEATEPVPTYLQDWGGAVGLMDEGDGGEVLGGSRNLELNINRW